MDFIFIQGVNVNLFPVAMKYEFSLRFLRFYLSPVHARAPTVDFVSPLGTHRWYRWGVLLVLLLRPTTTHTSGGALLSSLMLKQYIVLVS